MVEVTVESWIDLHSDRLAAETGTKPYDFIERGECRDCLAGLVMLRVDRYAKQASSKYIRSDSWEIVPSSVHMLHLRSIVGHRYVLQFCSTLLLIFSFKRTLRTASADTSPCAH